jgi:hypothetical protein
VDGWNLGQAVIELESISGFTFQQFAAALDDAKA